MDDEPRIRVAAGQLVRLFRAGLARRAPLVVVTLLYAAALAGGLAWSKDSYAPVYVLRVVEADRDPVGMPRPRRQLADYVRMAVFTSEPLLELMNRYHLYPSLARKNPRAALESFREDIEVDVRQNYFVEERAAGGAPRSARLIVRYRNADPDVAVRVTRELGELVAEHERASREAESAAAAAAARQQVEEARQALAARRAAVAEMGAELARDGDSSAGRRIGYIGLLGSLPALELQQDERERRAASLALGAALERRGIGMRFEVASDASLPADSGGRRARLVLAGLAFAFGWPLIAVGVGAFAPRRTSA